MGIMNRASCVFFMAVSLMVTLGCGQSAEHQHNGFVRFISVEYRFLWLIGSSILLLFVLVLVAILFIKSRRAGKELEQLVRQRTYALNLQTSMLTTIFNSSPDFIFCKDLNLHYTRCNKSMMEFLNIKAKDIIGKTDRNVFAFSPETAEKYIADDQDVIRSGQPMVFEESIESSSDGGKKLILETIKAPLIQNNAVAGIMGISRDITKRKEVEESALSASRSKSAFLANMSHEIRTPMNSIVGFSELALDGEHSPKTREYLIKILENSEWLLQIINDILDISKIESGKIELEKIPFEVHDLLASCRTLIMPKAVEKGIKLHYYAEPSVDKRPLGDPTRLRQVLVNLLSNAVKFTNSGIVKLHASIAVKKEKTITMHFEVKDSGIGMTAEQIDRVFDPFMQAEAGTTRKYGGTGLGLAITKNIVELMGGELYVESTPGVGSKFSFDLTFDTIDITDEELLEKKIIFDELKKPEFKGEILLCEDNVMNQQVICEHLARVGLTTVVAENGKIGVGIVKDRKEKGLKQFDLIFMDMHMPVMDGLEASTKIIELDTGIPIIAMTANIMSNDREIYRICGVNDCVGKPFSSQELWRCLMKYITPVKNVPAQKKHHAEVAPLPENDIKFQNRIKILFLQENRNKYEEIVKALEQGEIQLAHRLAHMLKSNAGQVGKIPLQQAAAVIEQQLKGGENLVIQEQLTLLNAELAAVLDEFDSAFLSQSGQKE